MDPDSDRKVVKPHDLIGFYDPNHKHPDRKALGFIDHDVRDKWEGQKNNVKKLKNRPKTARVKQDIAQLQGEINQSVVDVDVVGWLCLVYNDAIANSEDRHVKWKEDVKDMWKEVNYHWHLATGTLQDQLQVYYKNLLAMKELELWDDRDSFEGEEGDTGETTGFQL